MLFQPVGKEVLLWRSDTRKIARTMWKGGEGMSKSMLFIIFVFCLSLFKFLKQSQIVYLLFNKPSQA